MQVLSRLFRRLFLTALADAHAAGRLAFFGEIDGLRRRKAFDAYLAPLKRWRSFGFEWIPDICTGFLRELSDCDASTDIAV